MLTTYLLVFAMKNEMFLDKVIAKNPNEPEFIQAVEEFSNSVLPFINKNPKYIDSNILERIIEPERSIIFKVPWLDDMGKVQINRGFRVEFNSSIGPYKGGLRFHPTVNLSILKYDHGYYSEAEELMLEPGMNFYIYPGLRHQMEAIEDSELYEFSTEHFDEDSYRIIKGD